jgi:hypothetical protein
MDEEQLMTKALAQAPTPSETARERAFASALHVFDRQQAAVKEMPLRTAFWQALPDLIGMASLLIICAAVVAVFFMSGTDAGASFALHKILSVLLVLLAAVAGGIAALWLYSKRRQARDGETLRKK